MRKLILITIATMVPCLAWAVGGEDVSANGSWPTTAGVSCPSGRGRFEVFDGGGGYDSGVVTAELKNAVGAWKNGCRTASDCVWNTASPDSGAVPFNLGASAFVRFTIASVASDSDIDLGIVCGN